MAKGQVSVHMACVCLLVGCATTPGETARVAAPPLPPVLRDLSVVMKTLEASPHAMEGDVKHIRARELVGLSKEAIVAALGDAGTECDEANGAWCQRAGDFYFSFYTVCEGCMGGGPELAVRFNRAGKCTWAKWFISE